MIEDAPKVITPEWVRAQVDVMAQARYGSVQARVAMEKDFYRLVLLRIAEGSAQPPQHCAREALK